MQPFRLWNNILGWTVFAMATLVYLITAEPTVSFWDCGEYIATAYKLQVGHPPGAPFFQLMGRFFSLFALGEETRVALMVNTLSAVSSGFTILFLFWTISMLARKIVAPGKDPDKAERAIILGSALTGALAYTFSDSFWFSAVEGEVYAMSSFFTAVVFWAMLKWDETPDPSHALRWLILIAYLIGLSIGVHLLNLLAIPAISFIYYFKKYQPSLKGIVITLGVSFLLLALTLYGIIPWIVKLAGYSELLFVNGLGMPFDSGTIAYFLILSAAILYGLYWSAKHRKEALHAGVLAFVFLLIGYSSFFMLVIRSNADPPIDENNPEDAIGLLSYLNREQYGQYPIFKGPYYNAPVVDSKDGNPVYRKNRETGRYEIIDPRRGTHAVYDPRFVTLFPRMYSTQGSHIQQYKNWGAVKGVPIEVTSQEGGTERLQKPTFRENLRFFFRYQLDHMYFRYFMWNFAGRQNDSQGFGGPLDGNWISGISWLDEARLGPQYDIPVALESKANNRFFMLPLLLGLLGFFFHINKRQQDAWVVALLFFMTGIAIVLYLNQYAFQPRERDYAYAASFYAFAIWIGLGVLALYQGLKKLFNGYTAALNAAVISIVFVPGVMAVEGWNDHDRSGRYTARDMAINYLESCAPHAILFTSGDNDTFPLWYAQEVEGIRTDVRVVNLSLLNTDWYIDQLRRKAYDSDPLPFSLQPHQYAQGSREIIYIVERENLTEHVNVAELFQILHTQPDRLRINTEYGPVDYLPARHYKVAVDRDKVIANGTVSLKDTALIEPWVEWSLQGSVIQKNQLMILDLLAHNNWERPVYFAVTSGEDAYAGLTDYFRLEGMAYRLVPVRNVQKTDDQIGYVDTERMYRNLMQSFRFDMSNPAVFYNTDNVRMAMNMRNIYGRLANALVMEGNHEKAIQVSDQLMTRIPDRTIPYNFFVIPVAEAYYRAGAPEKGNEVLSTLLLHTQEKLIYAFGFPSHLNTDAMVTELKQESLAVAQEIRRIAREDGQEKLYEEATQVFDLYFGIFTGQPGYKSRDERPPSLNGTLPEEMDTGEEAFTPSTE